MECGVAVVATESQSPKLSCENCAIFVGEWCRIGIGSIGSQGPNSAGILRFKGLIRPLKGPYKALFRALRAPKGPEKGPYGP